MHFWPGVKKLRCSFSVVTQEVIIGQVGISPLLTVFYKKIIMKKFKSDIDEDFYKERASEYVRVENIGNALKVCDNCRDLELCHTWSL